MSVILERTTDASLKGADDTRQPRLQHAGAAELTIRPPRQRPDTGRLSWPTRLLKRALTRLIRSGTLRITAPDGTTFECGSGTPAVAIRIHEPRVIAQLLLDPELALGEAFVDGGLTIESGDLQEFIGLLLLNLAQARRRPARVPGVLRRLARPIAQYNPRPTSRANVAHHYDLPDDLYAAFLDPNRQYSCAYFPDGDDDLDRAQRAKMRHLAAKLLLRPGMRVLDVGCGWGGLAIELARSADVEVTGLTLSTEQLAYARSRAAALGLSDRVHFEPLDYRDAEGRYDRIVSVGMFEHVGIGHYAEYFHRIHDLLTDDGVALVHTIGRSDGPGATNAWITKYIFPGGYSPALSEMLPAIERSGLYLTDVEVLRLHYARTLRAWRERFNRMRADIVARTDERFCRMWEFYLAGSEASFRHDFLVNFQVQLSRRLDTVPLTRGYIEAWEATHAI